jgi:lysophospholipase L1-like esterase
MSKSKVHASRHCDIDIIKMNDKQYNKSNQNLVSSMQKPEGQFCTLSTFKNETTNHQPTAQDLCQRMYNLEKEVAKSNCNEGSVALHKNSEFLEHTVVQKDEMIQNLRAQLEHKTLEMQTAIAENTKLTTIMETNTACFTKQLEQKTVEINECQSIIHEQNQLIKNLQTKTLDDSASVKQSQHLSKNLNEKEQSFEAPIPVQNRCSPLQDTNSEDQSLAFRQTSESLKSIPDSKTAENFDLLIVADSHARSLVAKKLYRNKKVKIHVLAQGKKNVEGALEFLLSSSLICENVVVIVGSNDLSQGKSVQKVHQELINLAKAFTDKFTNYKLDLTPLIHRLDNRTFNLKVDEVNEKILELKSDKVFVFKNNTINAQHRHFFHADKIHLSRAGTAELAKIIKSNLNEHLGLKSYSEYNSFYEANYYDNYQYIHPSNYSRGPRYTDARPSLGPKERDLISRLIAGI